MITLYAFGPNFGLPDPSPFVLKTEVQLKMAGARYQVEYAGPPRGPKVKLPAIEEDGVLIGDSVFIRDHIERTRGIDLDAGLTADQRAIGWAVERMCEEQLYWALLHLRWAVPENFARGPSVFFGAAPDEVKEQGRRRVIAALHAHGLGRHTPDEIADLADRSLSALATLLGDKPFLFGDLPAGADASAFGAVAAILTPFFDSPVRTAAERHANLVAYRDRMMDRYYPAFRMAA
jgi:glutathione S-transferase